MVIITVLCVLIAVCIAVFAESHREFKSFIIKRYTVFDKKIPAAFNGYKLALIGDLHNACFGEKNAHIISALKEEKPDIVVLAGDMILCRERARSKSLETAEFITELSREFDIYYGIGNHERGARELTHKVNDLWDVYKAALPDNISILSDENVEIRRGDDKIYIYGLDIDRYFYKRIKSVPMDKDYIRNRLGAKPLEYTILLAHNPDYFDAYAEWGANLTLSGHIHGGMLRIPFLGGVISPKLRLFPKYDYGYFEKNDKRLIITSGLGAHFPKIRVNNKPELVMIELNRE